MINENQSDIDPTITIISYKLHHNVRKDTQIYSIFLMAENYHNFQLEMDVSVPSSCTTYINCPENIMKYNPCLRWSKIIIAISWTDVEQVMSH